MIASCMTLIVPTSQAKGFKYNCMQQVTGVKEKEEKKTEQEKKKENEEKEEEEEEKEKEEEREADDASVTDLFLSVLLVLVNTFQVVINV